MSASLSSTRRLRAMQNLPLLRVITPKLLLGLAKYTFLFTLLLNARSFPLVWHARVWWQVTLIRIQYWTLQARHIFSPHKTRFAAEERWFESIAPVGKNPFELVTSYKTWASVDDIDFNSHLSNSSYAKTLDFARFKAGLASFPFFYRSGGWTGLGGSSYSFIREIPMFMQYEVRTSIVAWDEKWLFLVSKFVTRGKLTNKDTGKGKHQTKMHNGGVVTDTPQLTIQGDSLSSSNLVTPSAPATPMIVNGAPNELKETGSIDDMKSLAARLTAADDDDTTLHCVAISQVCFKQGRITVPPAIVMSINGFSIGPQTASLSSETAETSTYSHTNPPPHWPHVKPLVLHRRANMKELQSFFKGGWREVPAGERWWEDAMGGGIEARRRTNLAVLEGVRQGMEGARGM